MARYTRSRTTRRTTRRAAAAPRRRTTVRRGRVAPRRTNRAASGRSQTIRIVVQNGPTASAAPVMLGSTAIMHEPTNSKRSRF